MSPNPNSFLLHLQESGYHPRSNKHSNALAEAIVKDLVAFCPSIEEKAGKGALVFALNFTVRAGTADWNVDLVLGEPQLGTEAEEDGVATILQQSPSRVQIAIEFKSVMTEHRKAVKNRKRDFEAHHEHVHHYSEDAIAGGVLVVNAAPSFQSPLRQDVTIHQNPTRLVEHCVSEFRAVAVRGGRVGSGLDARCAIVVDFDNINLQSGSFVTEPPAPQPGDPLHYDAFIRAICDCYTRRFG